MAKAPLPNTAFDWTIDWETGQVREDEIARRAKEYTADHVVFLRKQAEEAPTERRARFYLEQVEYADEYETSMVKVLTRHAEHLAWEFRVYVQGNRSEGVELDEAQIAGLTTDGRIH